MNAAISISYCGDHHKGNENGPTIPGHLHARMLRDTVNLLDYRERMVRPKRTGEEGYLEVVQPIPLIVCATAFPGITQIETRPDWPEREYLWEVFRKARFVTMPGNPGHQAGARWTIRMGIEAASKLGFDYLCCTSEDVIPRAGIIRRMFSQLHGEGADYCGEPWGEARNQLNSQFFACRVSSFATHFDGGAAVPCLEEYVMQMCERNGLKLSLLEHGYYDHTHEPDDHQRRIAEAMKC